jgi:hypothetical protein
MDTSTGLRKSDAAMPGSGPSECVLWVVSGVGSYGHWPDLFANSLSTAMQSSA